jgi:NAD dependent epimerase/dehydratase
MELSNKKVLVTGAGGFIGSHLVEAVVRKGCKVRAFVHYNSFNSWGWMDYLNQAKDIKNYIEIFSGDVRDPYGVKKAMRDIDIVFHLAALIGIPYSYNSPESYVDTNIKGTLNILQAGRELEIQKIIHTSTSEVYGTAQFTPITEEHPINPQSPYSATKAAADFVALSFYRSFNTPATVIRPFNTYGPRQSARAIIPTIISQIISKETKVRLGDVYPKRDFIYVKDTVQGFIDAAESDKSVGKVIHIGSSSEISISELANLIAKLMDSKIEIEVADERKRPEKSEVERLLADNSRARELIGWSPRYRLEDGIAETIKWFSNLDNLKFYKPDIYNI